LELWRILLPKQVSDFGNKFAESSELVIRLALTIIKILPEDAVGGEPKKDLGHNDQAVSRTLDLQPTRPTNVPEEMRCIVYISSFSVWIFKGFKQTMATSQDELAR